MAHRGSKMEEEALKSSIAADLESDVGVVRINARRMRIQRFKENVRRQERLAQLGLESAPVEVAVVDRQLADSQQKLEKLQDDGLEMVTNVAVAFKSREVDFRHNSELSQRQRQAKQQQDAELAQQRFDHVTELWDSTVKRAPGALHAHLTSLRTFCDELLTQKDAVIRSLEAELRCMEDEYNVEVATHGQDSTVLIQRMKDQLVILRNAYLRELMNIYDAMTEDLDDTRQGHDVKWQEKLDAIVAVEEKRLANYIQMTDDQDAMMGSVHREDADEFRQVRSTLEKDVELLQQQLEQLKAACLLNTEKLDYNYQILRRRDEESTITKSQQKRKLNKLQDTFNSLRQRLASQESGQRAELQQLTADIRRLTDMLVDLGERNQHFVSVHNRQLHQIFQMTHDSCRSQLDKVVRADKVIHEQQLGLVFQPPDLGHLTPPEMKAGSAMEVVRQSLAPASESETGPQAAPGPTPAAVLGPGPPLLRRLLLMLSDNAGFLVEEKLQRLLADIPGEEGELLRLDAIMSALGVRSQTDLEHLCGHFVRYASPAPSEQRLSPQPAPPPVVVHSSPVVVHSSPVVVHSSPVVVHSQSTSSGSPRPISPDDPRSSPDGGDGWPQAAGRLVSPDDVLHSLIDFMDAQRTRTGAAAGSAGRPAAGGRWAALPPPPVDGGFWRQFLHVQPESQRRLWRSLATGLHGYNKVLQERQSLRLQVLQLQQQNGDLRQLLHSHLSRQLGGSG